MPQPTYQIACVSFLNSKPLIDPLLDNPNIHVHFAVPSRLMALIESKTVSAALLSAVDYQLCRDDLLLVPAGMIGCDGPTLTVRIFSRVPVHEIKTLHADTDSHTSVMLAQVILQKRYGVNATLVPFDRATANDLSSHGPDTLLLIGDKVVNAAPADAVYPHQLDLGEEWKRLTGLPFVFAMWMMREDQLSSDLATLLAAAQQRGAQITEQLLDRHAAEHRWPRDLARRYFTEYLRYAVTPRDRAGLALFFKMAEEMKLLSLRRELTYLEVE
jgi:chorismate dehydratase